jgi:hypothetical protein
MTLPSDIADRLAQLGEDAARYEWIAESEGVESLRGFVGKLVESAALFEEWHPRLQEFAEQKRSENPLPQLLATDSFTIAQHRIMQPLIEKAERVRIRGDHTSVIFYAPLNSLTLLLNSWPAAVPNAVFLTPHELRQWNEIYHRKEDAFWWYVFQWWNIEFEIPEKSIWFLDSKPSLPSNVTPMLVTYGLQWDGFAGGEHADLWAWDGKCERFIDHVGDCDF